MKRVSLFLLTLLVIGSSCLSQKDNPSKGEGLAVAGALALGVAGAALEYQLWLEEVELMAFRHILDSRPEESACRVKLLTSDAKKFTDNSSTQAMVFAITFLDENEQEVVRNEILLMMLYPGYIMFSGLEYSKLQWFWFDETEWTNMKTTFIEMSTPADVKEGRVALYKEIGQSEFGAFDDQVMLKKGLVKDKAQYFEENGAFVPVEELSIRMKGFKTVGSGRNGVVPAYLLRNDDYIYRSYNDAISLIANERAFGMYFKEVGRIIQISRVDIALMESFLYDWSDFSGVESEVVVEHDGKMLVSFCQNATLSSGDQGFYEEPRGEFQEFTIRGISTTEDVIWRSDDELYFEDKGLFRGKILSANYDASRPFLEIEFGEGARAEIKKVSTLNDKLFNKVQSARCLQTRFVEVEFMDGRIEFLEDLDDPRIFRIQGQ